MANRQLLTRGTKTTHYGEVESHNPDDIETAICEFWDRAFDAFDVQHIPSAGRILVIPTSGIFSAGFSTRQINVVLRIGPLEQFSRETYPGVDADGDPLPGEDEWEQALNIETLRYAEMMTHHGVHRWTAYVERLKPSAPSITYTLYDEDDALNRTVTFSMS